MRGTRQRGTGQRGTGQRVLRYTDKTAINEFSLESENVHAQCTKLKYSSNLEDLKTKITNFKYIDPTIEKENKWIIKSVNNKSLLVICENYDQIKEITESVGERRLLVQKYIQDLYLIKQRKCKIRMFGLHTSFNGIHQGYAFNQGYCRLASRTYDKTVSTNEIHSDSTKLTERHLTRDCNNCMLNDSDEPVGSTVLTFDELSQYLPCLNELDELMKRMKNIMGDCMKATMK